MKYRYTFHFEIVTSQKASDPSVMKKHFEKEFSSRKLLDEFGREIEIVDAKVEVKEELL
jgi:hypothetical protein